MATTSILHTSQCYLALSRSPSLSLPFTNPNLCTITTLFSRLGLSLTANGPSTHSIPVILCHLWSCTHCPFVSPSPRIHSKKDVPSFKNLLHALVSFPARASCMITFAVQAIVPSLMDILSIPIDSRTPPIQKHFGSYKHRSLVNFGIFEASLCLSPSYTPTTTLAPSARLSHPSSGLIGLFQVLTSIFQPSVIRLRTPLE
jgi:hypothetical protein